MPLKYQSEIDGLNLNIICPENLVPLPTERTAYRYSFDPITHELNFLPNVVFDRITGGSYNYNSGNDDERKCRRCAASFFTNPSVAKNKWNNLPEKIRDNMGYTHIAEGKLAPEDGLVTTLSKDGHFSLYEDENADLTQKFKIIDSL